MKLQGFKGEMLNMNLAQFHLNSSVCTSRVSFILRSMSKKIYAIHVWRKNSDLIKVKIYLQ